MRSRAGKTYRRTTSNGTIYGADSKTVPWDRTFWTDDDGDLVGRPQGGPGQQWILEPWTAPPPPKADGEAVLRTGLFGPLGRIFG